MKLQKLEYVIFGRFQRPITPKFWGAGKTDHPMTQSRPPLSYGIGFMVVGCVVSESISAQNQKKSVTDGRTDGRTDRQVQNDIPSLRGG